MNRGLPQHLDTIEAKGLCENEVIAQFQIGLMSNFIYLLLDWSTKKAAIVDPQKDLSEPLAALTKYGFQLTHILLTHTHHDHIAGVNPLLKKYPTLKIEVGKLDLHRLDKTILDAPGLSVVGDGDTVVVGTLQLKVISTPGHSAGEMCYFLAAIPAPQLRAEMKSTPPYLFTGDTIFIRDCGRTDFPDGSNDQMFASIQKIKTLPPETIFLVGHHYAKECATTLSDELRESGPFKCRTVEELAALP